MKKAFAVLFALLVFAFSAPAFAQEDPVWKHGTDAWIFGLAWEKNPGEDTLLQTDGQWLHYVTDQQAWGVSLSLLKVGDTESAAVGPAWEWNFPGLKKGHFFILTQAQIAAGDLSDVATALGVLGVGYKLHVGNSSAVRFTVDYSDTIDDADDAPPLADDLSGRYTLGIAIELGVNKSTPVQ